MNRRIRLACAAAVLGAATFLLPFGTEPSSAAGGDRIFQMTIHNDTESRALSDRPEEEFTKYTDYQWNPSSEQDICVFATAHSTGMAYTGLNRRQGFEDNLWCNEHFAADGNPLPDRYYTLMIGDRTACDFLVNNGLIPTADDLPCTLTPDRHPRVGGFQPHVRLETLFKNKAKTTPVRFQFELIDGRQYSVDIDGAATIVQSSTNPNLKFVTYTGTASFRNFSTGKIGNSFPFPLHLEFLRQ